MVLAFGFVVLTMLLSGDSSAIVDGAQGGLGSRDRFIDTWIVRCKDCSVT